MLIPLYLLAVAICFRAFVTNWLENILQCCCTKTKKSLFNKLFNDGKNWNKSKTFLGQLNKNESRRFICHCLVGNSPVAQLMWFSWEKTNIKPNAWLNLNVDVLTYGCGRCKSQNQQHQCRSRHRVVGRLSPLWAPILTQQSWTPTQLPERLKKTSPRSL